MLSEIKMQHLGTRKHSTTCSRWTGRGTTTARRRGPPETGAAERTSFRWTRPRGITSFAALVAAWMAWRFLLSFIRFLRRPSPPPRPSILPGILLQRRRVTAGELLWVSFFSLFGLDLGGSSVAGVSVCVCAVSKFWIRLCFPFFFFWYWEMHLWSILLAVVIC